jgi:putative Mn2+ efflux pump MntP
MKNIWLPFAVVAVVVGFTFSTLTSELRQEVAKYVIFGFLAAALIKPIGLTIGNFLRKLIKKN